MNPEPIEPVETDEDGNPIVSVNIFAPAAELGTTPGEVT